MPNYHKKTITGALYAYCLVDTTVEAARYQEKIKYMPLSSSGDTSNNHELHPSIPNRACY